MNSKYEISMLGYLPLTSRISLKSEFRQRLFEKSIKMSGSLKNLASSTGVHRRTLSDWRNGKTTPTLEFAFKCSKLANVTEEEFINNIVSIRNFYYNGSISIDKWKLPVNEELMEWFGILHGDGSVGHQVTCGNTHFNIVYFFSEILEKYFGIPKDRISFSIVLPENGNLPDSEEIKREIREHGYIKIFTYKRKNNSIKAKRILIEAYAYSTILSSLLKVIKSDLFELIKNSSNEIKAAYIRGFSAAEGCVSGSKGSSNRILISQKDTKILEFIKSLLFDIGIQNVTDPIAQENASSILISTKKDLELFYKLIGFGKHEDKNEKLKKILDNYQIIKPYQSRNGRYILILELVRQKRKITCKEIAKEIDTNYRWANKLVTELIELNLLKAENKNKPYTYSLL